MPAAALVVEVGHCPTPRRRSADTNLPTATIVLILILIIITIIPSYIVGNRFAIRNNRAARFLSLVLSKHKSSDRLPPSRVP